MSNGGSKTEPLAQLTRPYAVFPEMRAQLRTYHAIPCLQATQDPNAYKQLQDAPRLKSILKGACEDKREPNTIDGVKSLPVPRTNPVNLIFVLSQYAPKLTEVHFSLQLDFFDLVTRTTLSSRSRARGFLWLMWWYLESDFSAQDAARNPFGPGQAPEVDGGPQKLPPFEHLTEEQKELENVDSPDEVEYGLRKQDERRREWRRRSGSSSDGMQESWRTMRPSSHRPRREARKVGVEHSNWGGNF